MSQDCDEGYMEHVAGITTCTHLFFKDNEVLCTAITHEGYYIEIVVIWDCHCMDYYVTIPEGCGGSGDA